jgi:hypothetical protein
MYFYLVPVVTDEITRPLLRKISAAKKELLANISMNTENQFTRHRYKKERLTWQYNRELPAGVDGISGDTLTGFAHGVSGIVYFLAEYARSFSNTYAKIHGNVE